MALALDATECVEVTKAWLMPASTAGRLTGGGQVLNAAHTDQVAFGFNSLTNGSVRSEAVKARAIRNAEASGFKFEKGE